MTEIKGSFCRILDLISFKVKYIQKKVVIFEIEMMTPIYSIVISDKNYSHKSEIFERKSTFIKA
jgi:hypothetical protein